MQASMASLLLAALLPLQALAQPLGLEQCRALRARRDQLAAEAMQAEIALVLATRRRLCPQQEAAAEQANADSGRGSGSPSAADAAGQNTSPADPAPAALDYAAYLGCRREAEGQLRRTRVILYTNRQGFTFYTLAGARLARQADAWQQRLSDGCVPTVGA
jgi:hypothetical protein